jgi:hypothetical protein
MRMNLNNSSTLLVKIARFLAVADRLVVSPVMKFSAKLAYLPEQDREYIYTLLSESVRSNIVLDTVFTQIEEDSSSKKMARFARFARRGLLTQEGDFTLFLAESGLVPQEEIALLKIGVSRSKIPEICDFLASGNGNSITFNSHFLKEGKGWLVSIPIGMIAVVYFRDTFRTMRNIDDGGLHPFFIVADWTVNYWPLVLFVTFWAFTLHRLALPNLKAGRTDAYKFGLFKFYDSEWELKLARICEVLVPTGLPNSELLGNLARIAQPNKRLYHAIIRAQRNSGELDVVEALSIFMSSETISKVKAKSPDKTPSSVGDGFSMAIRINYISFERSVKKTTSFLVMALMLIALVFFGPLVAISSGV